MYGNIFNPVQSEGVTDQQHLFKKPNSINEKMKRSGKTKEPTFFI